MKKIYFALDRKGLFAAATGIAEMARFLDCHPQTIRRAFRESSEDVIQLRKGKVYKTYLNKIEGRGNLQNLSYIRH